MTDFRIILAPDDEFSDRELEWVEASHQWRLSDKEYGSVTWEFDRNPNKSALEGLRDFFELPGQFVALDAINGLSPAELANMHAQYNQPPRIRAVQCEACGQHWIVYKKSGMWLKYGRKCAEGGWWLGVAVADNEVMDTLGN